MTMLESAKNSNECAAPYPSRAVATLIEWAKEHERMHAGGATPPADVEILGAAFEERATKAEAAAQKMAAKLVLIRARVRTFPTTAGRVLR
jgi:hypothetical protein